MPVGPREREGPDAATGLNAKDEVSASSKKFSVLFPGASAAKVEFLPFPLRENGNFPVVGDGRTCN